MNKITFKGLSLNKYQLFTCKDIPRFYKCKDSSIKKNIYFIASIFYKKFSTILYLILIDLNKICP